MKGLKVLPSLADLTKAYHRWESASQDSVPTPVEIVQHSQWARLDPRLAELMVRGIARNFKKIPCAEMNQELFHSTNDTPWPSALGPILEEVRGLISRESQSVFRAWLKCVMTDVPRAPFEIYFIGIYPFAGESTRSHAQKPLSSFLKWGYLGKDPIYLDKRTRVKPQLSTKVRRQLLDQWILTQKRFDIRDYESMLGGHVSRRSAERDLASHPKISSSGKTRARFYRVLG